MKSRTDRNFGRLILGIGAIVVSVVLLVSSCNTPRRLCKIHSKRPVMVADSCISWFPVKTDTAIKTIVIQGKTDTTPSTILYVNCDSVEILKGLITGLSTNHVACPPCPPSTHTVDTIKTTTVIRQEDSAKIYAAMDKLNKVQINYDKLQVSEKRWKNWAIGLGVSLLIFIIIACFMAYRLIKPKA